MIPYPSEFNYWNWCFVFCMVQPQNCIINFIPLVILNLFKWLGKLDTHFELFLLVEAEATHRALKRCFVS